MKLSKALGAAAILALPLHLAHAQGPALNAQLAVVDISGFDPGIALMVGYEHPMPMIHENVSIEGEFSASIVNPENTYTIAGTNFDEELSYYTAGAFLKYTHPLNQKFSLYGRAGVHYERVTYDTNYFNASGTDSSVGKNIGIGADLHMNESLDLTIGATLYDSDSDYNSDIKHISAGVKVKF